MPSRIPWNVAVRLSGHAVGIALVCMMTASTSSFAIEPSLEADPEVMKLIDGLGEKSSVELPPIKTMGEWNAVTKEFGMQRTGPRGRDFTLKAVWMPDRKRAFFCGANHGSPHRLNDAWEYDLPSNTWVMLFAPDPNNARGVMEIVEKEIPAYEPPQEEQAGDQHGPDGTEPKPAKKVLIVETERGGPTHYGHTWWGLAYDPNMKATLWMNAPIGSSPQSYIEKQGHAKKEAYAGPPLWAFYPEKKKWMPILTHTPRPRSIYAGAMEYVPELGGVFWYMANWNGSGMWVYHPRANGWENLKPNDGHSLYHFDQTPKTEAVMAYDASTKTVVAVKGRDTYHYDPKKNEWRRVLSDSGDERFSAHDARTPFDYDPTSQVCLLYSQKTPDSVWSYDTKAMKWTRNQVDGPAGPTGGKLIAYFDAARNVLVVNQGDKTWLYRHGTKAE